MCSKCDEPVVVDRNALEDFKKLVADFVKDSPTMDRETLESDWSWLSSRYLKLPTDGLTLNLAVGYLTFASKRYLHRSFELNH